MAVRLELSVIPSLVDSREMKFRTGRLLGSYFARRNDFMIGAPRRRGVEERHLPFQSLRHSRRTTFRETSTSVSGGDAWCDAVEHRVESPQIPIRGIVEVGSSTPERSRR
jgi:hypothetical protein